MIHKYKVPVWYKGEIYSVEFSLDRKRGVSNKQWGEIMYRVANRKRNQFLKKKEKQCQTK